MDLFERNLEEDMQQLAAEVQKHRERPEMENATAHEIIKESLRSFPKLEQPVEAGNAEAATSEHMSPLPEYAADASPETKLEIEYLLDTAFKKGLGAALSQSEKSTAFIQDAFRDALSGRLYPELQKRGLVP
jgi:hypothetical protein